MGISILQVVDNLFTVYFFMLFLRILSSWIPDFQNTAFFRFIGHYTDPYLNIFRRIIPPLGMFDLSPIVAFFCLQIIQSAVKGIFS